MLPQSKLVALQAEFVDLRVSRLAVYNSRLSSSSMGKTTSMDGQSSPKVIICLDQASSILDFGGRHQQQRGVKGYDRTYALRCFRNTLAKLAHPKYSCSLFGVLVDDSEKRIGSASTSSTTTSAPSAGMTFPMMAMDNKNLYEMKRGSFFEPITLDNNNIASATAAAAGLSCTML